MWRVEVTPETPLVGEVDAEERFERFPRSYTLKGMFYTRLLNLVGADWELVKPQLLAPPPHDRYIAYKDYPQVDYSRLCHAAAVRRYPRVSVPEAMRRVGRHDIHEFAESRIGRVSLALVGDLEAALLRMPKMYELSMRGGRVTSSRLPAGDGVRLAFTDFWGWVDCYPLGTIEGLVTLLGGTPRIEVEFRGDHAATFDVRWRAA